MNTSYYPDRGDAIWLEFNPQTGREQAGHRPAIIISPKSYNKKVGLAIVCPITSKVKGYPFEVGIPSGHPVDGVILADQVKSFDWRGRNAKFICKIPEQTVSEVVKKMLTLIA